MALQVQVDIEAWNVRVARVARIARLQQSSSLTILIIALNCTR